MQMVIATLLARVGHSQHTSGGCRSSFSTEAYLACEFCFEGSEDRVSAWRSYEMSHAIHTCLSIAQIAEEGVEGWNQVLEPTQLL